MSHEPPIPEAARSPYPLHPAPHVASDAADTESEGPGSILAESAALKAAGQSWADKARETFDRASESKVALGAAVGIGSAALLAAILFSRRGKSTRA